MKYLILLGYIFSSCLCLASELSVQKFPLAFRSGDRAGVLGKFKIEGKDYALLIDSGASGHSLNYKVVDRLKLTLGSTGKGSTPYGDIQTIQVGSVNTMIEGMPIELKDVITVKDSEGDSSLEKDDIWGAVSPSMLASGKFVILDLLEPAMYLVGPIQQDVMAWLKAKYPNFEFDKIERVSGRPYVEIIQASADPFGSLKMTVDSGATTSNIYADTKVDASKGLAIRIGKHSCATQKARIRPTNSPGHQNHLLGMDCLSGKILVLPPVDFSMLWIGWLKK